jgi:hypothetical protein
MASSTHPRIEELPDDFDESLDLNAPTPPTAPTAEAEIPLPLRGNEERLRQLDESTPAPKLPPAMAAVDSHTTDELADILNKTPLFMTDISKAGDERAWPGPLPWRIHCMGRVLTVWI